MSHADHAVATIQAVSLLASCINFTIIALRMTFMEPPAMKDGRPTRIWNAIAVGGFAMALWALRDWWLLDVTETTSFWGMLVRVSVMSWSYWFMWELFDRPMVWRPWTTGGDHGAQSRMGKH